MSDGSDASHFLSRIRPGNRNDSDGGGEHKAVLMTDYRGLMAAERNLPVSKRGRTPLVLCVQTGFGCMKVNNTLVKVEP